MSPIEAAFAEGIAEYLNAASPPSASDLRERLERAAAVWAVVSELVSVITMEREDKPTYVTAIGLTFCGSCSRTWLGVYQSDGKRYVNTVQLDDPLLTRRCRRSASFELLYLLDPNNYLPPEWFSDATQLP